MARYKRKLRRNQEEPTVQCRKQVLAVMDSPSLPSGRFGATLIRYVAQELLFPVFFAFLGLTLLILTKDLLSFSDLVINRGFGIGAVSLIALYEIVPLAAHTLPFAVLVGSLIGLGRLKADNEILAIEAAGVPGRKLIIPVLCLAALTTMTGLVLNLFAAPWASRSLAAALLHMARENPGLSLRAGTVHDFNGIKLSVREVSAHGDQLRGVLLWIPEHGQTLFAERGEIAASENGIMQLVLHDGVMLVSPQNEGEETRFATFWQILRDDRIPRRREEDQMLGASLSELSALSGAEADKQNLARRARIELHRRFSYPAASLFFGLLAVPLVLTRHRFSRAAGGVTGFVVTILYYGLMQLGDGLVLAGVVDAWMGVWLPNVAMGGLALVLLEQNRFRWVRRRSMHGQTASEETAVRRTFRLPRLHRYLLQRYVAYQYTHMLALSFAVLLVGYLLVDLLERLQWFARYQAETGEILRFYRARLPFLVSQIVPMVLLLATALTVSSLSTHCELIGMRACGVSVARVLIPILLIATAAAPVYFSFNEYILPRTNTLAEQIKEREIKGRVPRDGPLGTMIWYRMGTRVAQVSQLDPKLGEAQELSIYDLGTNGLPVSRTNARTATYLGNGMWKLADPVRVEISDYGLRQVPASPQMQLGEAPNQALDTKQLGAWELARQIHDAEANGYHATTYHVDLHVKLATPFSCILLPAVALIYAIGGPPFPGPAQTILMSSILGVGYILLTGVFASVGYGGFLPPILAGWAPALSLIVLIGILARRS